MNILRLTDRPPELEAVKDKVLEELQYLRSLDTAGDGAHSLTRRHTLHLTHTSQTGPHSSKCVDLFYLHQFVFFIILITFPHSLTFSNPADINVIKNQINSLLFVRKICETRIQRLQSGKVSSSATEHSSHSVSLSISRAPIQYYRESS